MSLIGKVRLAVFAFLNRRAVFFDLKDLFLKNSYVSRNWAGNTIS
jgi:hypothetical protein